MTFSVADLASPDPVLGLHAFIELTGPALWHNVVRGVRQAKPGSCSCDPLASPRSGGLPHPDATACVQCTSEWTRRLTRSYDAFRRALTDGPPTAPGPAGQRVPVREWVELIEFVASPDADLVDIAEVSGLLLELTRSQGRDGAQPRPGPPERGAPPVPDAATPRWVVAAHWQLVRYFANPSRVVADVRRASATERDMDTRPELAIANRDWSAPLRADPVSRDILIHFILGIRDEVSDPYALPDMETRFGLTPGEVSARLAAQLRLLREIRPEFFWRNVGLPLAQREGVGEAHMSFEQAEASVIARADAERLARADPAEVARVATPALRGLLTALGLGPTGEGVPDPAVVAQLRRIMAFANGADAEPGCAGDTTGCGGRGRRGADHGGGTPAGLAPEDRPLALLVVEAGVREVEGLLTAIAPAMRAGGHRHTGHRLVERRRGRVASPGW